MDKEKEHIRKRNIVATYNMLINLFWSALNLIPITIFCYEHLSVKLLVIFISLAFVSLFFPRSFFNRIQIGSTRRMYKKLGVEFINKFTQNGELVNNLIKKRFPDYRVVGTSKQSAQKLISQTYMFERYHFMMFLIFVSVTIYALAKGFWNWAIIILLCNIVYNVYPTLLQEYIRIRLQILRRNQPVPHGKK